MVLYSTQGNTACTRGMFSHRDNSIDSVCFVLGFVDSLDGVVYQRALTAGESSDSGITPFLSYKQDLLQATLNVFPNHKT